MARYLVNLSKLIAIFTLTACGSTMANKFDWKATESAPENFAMKIVSGHFYSPDGYSLYIPNKKRIRHGWGRGVSSHLVGPDLKSLPNKMSVTYFSYTENKFYQGEFDLPHDKILRLFSDGYYSPKEQDHTTYFEIIAGVAPGGTVSVWLGGIDRTVEVFSGQADEVDLDWSEINNNPEITRQEYINRGINDTASQEAIKLLETKGVPANLWKAYTKRYNWQPLFSGQEPPELINRIRYYNGEDEYLFYPLDDDFKNKLHAIPKELIFRWDWPKGRTLVFELQFVEEEIFAAFEKLEKAGLPIYLEMLMEPTDKGPLFWVLVKNDNEYVVLRKPKLENYKPANQ